MHPNLWRARDAQGYFTVEVSKLLDQVEIVEQQRATRAGRT
jgi:hypothetical protein